MTRGVYCVAFGDPSRECALRLIASLKRYMPDVPVALCSDRALGPEDVLVLAPDSDVGGRRAKLRAYDLAPREWDSVLYLDADTELVAPVHRFFEWVEDGWDFVICRDVGETLHSFQRKNNLPEHRQLEAAVGTLHALQFNGGVWAFRRGPAAEALMRAWLREWEVHAQRDQGALVRAIHECPLRLLVLGNEWNTFPVYTPGVATAGVLHHAGEARRWVGKLPGRIDGPEAWARVNKNVEKARRTGAPASHGRPVVPRRRNVLAARSVTPGRTMHLRGTAAEIERGLRLWGEPPKIPDVRLQLLGYQLTALHHLARAYDRDGARLLEIGTGHGGSGLVLSRAAPRSRIISLTTNPAEKTNAEKFWARSGAQNIAARVEASWDYIERTQVEWDLVFVDGDHNRIARDLPWFDRLKNGGLLVCHDYSPQDSRSPSGVVYQELNAMAARLGRAFDVRVVDDGKVGMAGFYRRAGEVAWPPRS